LKQEEGLPSDAIIRKAEAHARKRIDAGLSPFHQEGEEEVKR